MGITTISIAAADADGIATSQTPAATGVQNITLDGALVTTDPKTGVNQWLADTPRLVSITSAGNDTGRTFTITGENEKGVATSEEVTGASGAAATSTVTFARITSITTDDDTAGAITVGTTSAVTTQWIPMDLFANPFSVSLGVVLAGSSTVTYTVQHTFSDVQDSTVTASAIDHDSLASQTATNDGNYAFPVRAVRLTNAGFTAGSLDFSVGQSGVGG
jgi:hypothetical protein